MPNCSRWTSSLASREDATSNGGGVGDERASLRDGNGSKGSGPGKDGRSRSVREIAAEAANEFEEGRARAALMWGFAKVKPATLIKKKGDR